jgi:hypothetical protein
MICMACTDEDRARVALLERVAAAAYEFCRTIIVQPPGQTENAAAYDRLIDVLKEYRHSVQPARVDGVEDLT